MVGCREDRWAATTCAHFTLESCPFLCRSFCTMFSSSCLFTSCSYLDLEQVIALQLIVTPMLVKHLSGYQNDKAHSGFIRGDTVPVTFLDLLDQVGVITPDLMDQRLMAISNPPIQPMFPQDCQTHHNLSDRLSRGSYPSCRWANKGSQKRDGQSSNTRSNLVH